MSLSDLLIDYPKPWANLYVNSIKVAQPTPPQVFNITFIVANAAPPLPQSFNTQAITVQAKLERFGDLYLLSTAQFVIPTANQRLGVLIADLSNSPLAGTACAGTDFAFLQKVGSAINTVGWGCEMATNRLVALNTASSGGFTTGNDCTVARANIWLRAP